MTILEYFEAYLYNPCFCMTFYKGFFNPLGGIYIIGLEVEKVELSRKYLFSKTKIYIVNNNMLSEV